MKSLLAFSNRLPNMGPQSIKNEKNNNKFTFIGKTGIVKSSFSGQFSLLLSYFQSSSNCSPNFLQSIVRGFLRNALYISKQ